MAGQPKKIKDPERMWDLFCAYRSEVRDNPIMIVEQKKGNTILPKGLTAEEFKMYANTIIELPARRPLTMEGFENYCADLDVIQDLGDYFSNKNDAYKEFSTICSRIKREIRQDQIEGGMVGIYNPSITQRLNGLVEKTALDANVKQLTWNETRNYEPDEKADTGS